MRKFKSILIENLNSIDIETVRLKETFDELSELEQEAWGYKNKQDGEVPEPEILADMYIKRAALYAEFSKICAVSITTVYKEELLVREIYGKDEKDILERLVVSLEKIRERSSNNILIGHAANYFDYPFICKRLIVNNIEIPIILDNVLGKPWDNENLCTNELWRMGGSGAGSSLQALCVVLNVPISKVDLVGDEVGKAYYNDELPKIGRYCSYDTIATLNVARKMRGEPIFEFEEARYIGKEVDVPLLERIYNTKNITDKDKKELREILGKKRLTKKNKDILVNMFHSLVVNSKIFEMDKPSIIKEKLEVVKNLILKM